jgi:hypothetical protein
MGDRGRFWGGKLIMVLTFTELANLRGTLIQMGHEPNNELVEYYLKSDRVRNDMGEPNKGNYTGITFEPITNRVPIKPYSLFGIKTFPKMGAYGWFRSKYEHITHILVPLVSPQTRYTPPTFTFSQTSTTVQITIVPPASVEYDCYRILFREEHFATEFITYDTFAEVSKPTSGTYELYIIGYRDTGEISEETPRQAITIVNPTPTPVAGPVYSVNSELPDIIGNIYLPANKVPVDVETIEADNVEDALVEVDDIGITITLTVAGWSSFAQTVAAPGVTATNKVIVSPTPADQGLYVSSAILCTAQGTDTLTFNCNTVPTFDIEVGVIIL